MPPPTTEPHEASQIPVCDPPPQPSRRATRVLLLAIVALAVAGRLAATFAFGKGSQSGTEYGNIGWHIRHGWGYRITLTHIYDDSPRMKSHWMMPFYPCVLAASKVVSPRSYTYVYVLQSLAAGAVACIVFRLARGIYGARAGLLSAALFALYPSFVYSCIVPHPLCWELAALPLALLACLGYLARPTRWRLAGCAAATLWAAYIRSAWVVLVPVVVVLMAAEGGGWRRMWRSALAFCLLVAVGLVPWVARNYVELGVVRLTSIDFPLWEGHNALGNATGYGPGGRNVVSVRGSYPELAAELEERKHDGEVAILSVFRRAALEEIRRRPWQQLAVLPATRAFYFVLWDPYHPKSRHWLLYRIPYLALLALAIGGLLVAWRRPTPWSRFGLWGVVAVWVAGCVTVAAFHYLPRFRMPAELMFMLPAGYFGDRALAWLGRHRAPRAGEATP